MANPYSHKEKVQVVIISNRAHPRLKGILEAKGISVIFSVDCPSLPSAISHHPDMVLHSIQHGQWVIAKEVYSYYEQAMKKCQVDCLMGSSILKREYPFDIAYNISRTDKCYIHKEGWTDPVVRHAYRDMDISPIFVNQGYSKCSTVIINENTIITQDKSIWKQLGKAGIFCHLLPMGGILLPPYNTGFIGGTCGMISKNELLFYGDPANYPFYRELDQILQKEEIHAIYPKGVPFEDLGSIFGVV